MNNPITPTSKYKQHPWGLDPWNDPRFRANIWTHVTHATSQPLAALHNVARFFFSKFLFKSNFRIISFYSRLKLQQTSCEIINWYKCKGTIHILRQHLFGTFLTHPLTMSTLLQYWTSHGKYTEICTVFPCAKLFIVIPLYSQFTFNCCSKYSGINITLTYSGLL